MDKMGMGTDVMSAADAMKKQKARGWRVSPQVSPHHTHAQTARSRLHYFCASPAQEKRERLMEQMEREMKTEVEAHSFDDLSDEDIDKTEL